MLPISAAPKMRSQPNRNYVSNDDIQTPLALARQLVAHFRPTGTILEPCRGEGNFLKALREHAKFLVPSIQQLETRVQPLATSSQRLGARHSVLWCEIKRDRDFFTWNRRVDWVVTNPPWSQIRAFLQHAMAVSDHVVFLLTINHVWTKARLRDIREAGFGLKEIVLVDMPKSFPQSGFQLGAIHLQRGWRGKITISKL